MIHIRLLSAVFIELIIFSLSGAIPIAVAADEINPKVELLAPLRLLESSQPVKESALWKKPRHIILTGPRITPERVTALRQTATGIDLTIVPDINEWEGELDSIDAVIGSCELPYSAMSRLHWVQDLGAGVESCVDLQGLQTGKVLLTNMKGMYGPGIAEHVVAMMLSLTRGLYVFRDQQHEHNWNRLPVPILEVQDKTMLIVGLGGIGTEIARRAHALGMQVLATRNSSRSGPDFVEYVGLADELLELTKRADVVVNATPLTDTTRGLFDKVFFQTMQPSAYFINIGRGGSVVTEALIQSLRNGELAGAALDVTDPEPLPAEHELWDVPNVIITPHMSAASDLRAERITVLIQENLRRYINGERMLNMVDIEKGY